MLITYLALKYLLRYKVYLIIFNFNLFQNFNTGHQNTRCCCSTKCSLDEIIGNCAFQHSINIDVIGIRNVSASSKLTHTLVFAASLFTEALVEKGPI